MKFRRLMVPVVALLVTAGIVVGLHWAGASVALAANCLWTGAVNGDWATTGNWSSCQAGNQPPAPGDTVTIPDIVTKPVLGPTTTASIGALVLLSDTSLLVQGNLNLEDGITGTGSLSVTGAVTWAGGAFAGLGATTVYSTGRLNIAGTGSRVLAGRPISATGIIDWTGPSPISVTVPSRLAIGQNGIVEIRNDEALISAGGPLTIENRGLIRKSALTGATRLDLGLGAFDQRGDLVVVSGTLLVENAIGAGRGQYTVGSGSRLVLGSGVSLTLPAGSRFGGPGALEILSGAVEAQGVEIRNLEVQSGTFRSTADLTVTGDLRRTGPGALDFLSGTVRFAGVTTQALDLRSPTTITNLTVVSGTTLVEVQPGANVTVPGTLRNDGIIRKSQAISGTGPVDFGLTRVAISVTQILSQGFVTIDRYDRVHPRLGDEALPGPYWRIAATGTISSAELSLPHTITPNQLALVCRLTGTGSDWACGRSFSTESRVVLTGVTNLTGDWTVGQPGGNTLFMPVVLKEKALTFISAAPVVTASNKYGSGLMIVNLAISDTANVLIQAYDGNGLHPTGWPTTGVTTTIAAGQPRSLFSGNAGDVLFSKLPTNTQVSLVITSDQRIAATVNSQRVGTASGGEVVGTPPNPFRVGTSAAVNDLAASPSVYASQVTAKDFSGPQNGFNARVYVQNTVAVTTTTTWQLFDRAGAQVDTFTRTIPGLATFEFDPNTRPALGSDMYSLKVTSDDPARRLALTVNYFNLGSNAATSQLFSYNGAGSGSTTLFAPRVVRRYYGYNSGLRVQNIGDGPTDIRFIYTFGSETITHTVTGILPGQSAGPYLGDDTTFQKPAGLPNNATGSLVIESLGGQPLIGNVNEDNRELGQGATYELFRIEQATRVASLPQVVNALGNPDLDTIAAFFVSGIQFQNTASVPSPCTVTFAAPGRTDVVLSLTVPPTGSVSQFLANVAGLGIGFNGSATIRCDQPVVAIANLSVRSKADPNVVAGVGDSFGMTAAINVEP